MQRWSFVAVLGIALSTPSWGEEASTPAATTEAEAVTPPARVAIFMPEQIDGDWYWYDHGAGQQHLTQTAFEKAFVKEGFDILDVANIGGRISYEDLFSPKTATAKGKELGADYVVAGKATGSKVSEGSAYGVGVIRARAEITARLVRISDGKVLAVEDGTAEAGGQAIKAASQDALKKAAPPVARKLANALKQAQEPVEATPAP